jgi:hypothetical protein
LSPAADLAPSWKLEHPTNEEQKAVQWTLQSKAQEIASRHQSVMNWLTPIYSAKVPTVVAVRLAVEQKSPIVEHESPAVVADRPVVEQKNSVVVADRLVVEQKNLIVVEDNLVAEEESLPIAEEELSVVEEGSATLGEGPAHMELIQAEELFIEVNEDEAIVAEEDETGGAYEDEVAGLEEVLPVAQSSSLEEKDSKLVANECPRAKKDDPGPADERLGAKEEKPWSEANKCPRVVDEDLGTEDKHPGAEEEDPRLEEELPRANQKRRVQGQMIKI